MVFVIARLVRESRAPAVIAIGLKDRKVATLVTAHAFTSGTVG